MPKDIQELLSDPDSVEHGNILTYVKRKVDRSRKDMSRFYDKWDRNAAIFKGDITPDKQDQEAQRKGQPAKMVMPVVKSQIMTFVAFCVTNLTQNARFYELEATGTEDNPLREPFELILERDVRRNNWTSFLVQFFLDIGRFSLGCAEVCYEEQYRNVRMPQVEVTEEAFGIQQEKQTLPFVKLPVFVGNKVHSISPYRFFPDTNYSLDRFQEGEFCASEDFWSLSSLQGSEGPFINLDKIPKMTKTDMADRQKNTRGDFADFQIRENPNLGGKSTSLTEGDYVTEGPVLVTKVVVDITPKNLKISPDTKLGEEDFSIRYVCWIANDKVIIRFEEAYYLHGQFPYVASPYLPDHHEIISECLADDCTPIATLITWLTNAHTKAQRSSIWGKYAVDPSGVDMKTLDAESPYVILKKSAAQTGIDRYLKQLQTVDTTANNMNDVGILITLNEKFSGYSAQMQGSYSEGRRSATQDRVVAQGASARGKTILSPIWDTALEPLAKQFIANNRQEMDFETFSRILGAGPFDVAGIPATADQLFLLFKSDPIGIASSEDFFVFDGTQPSEKAFLAQSLQELALAMLQNPEIASIMGYGPQQLHAMISEIYTLRGVTNSNLPAPMPMAPPQAPPTGNVMPMPGMEGSQPSLPATA